MLKLSLSPYPPTIPGTKPSISNLPPSSSFHHCWNKISCRVASAVHLSSSMMMSRCHQHHLLSSFAYSPLLALSFPLPYLAKGWMGQHLPSFINFLPPSTGQMAAPPLLPSSSSLSLLRTVSSHFLSQSYVTSYQRMLEPRIASLDFSHGKVVIYIHPLLNRYACKIFNMSVPIPFRLHPSHK